MAHKISSNIADLAFKLCEIPSITYDEGQVLQFLLQWCETHGFLVEKIPVSHNEQRFNLLVCSKKQDCYSVILCTHIDTVPPFIAPRIEGEVLWGRGSCDAKGIAAAMLTALLHERDQGFDDIAVLLTVGEEESSDGAKACKGLKGRGKYLVVGEPTDLRAASAQKGTLVFDLVAKGVESHSSLPGGNSALHKLISATHKLLMKPLPVNNTFGETLLNIGHMEGGRARNMLAGEARAQCILRLSEPSSQIITLIEACLGAEITLEIASVSEPFLYSVPPDFPTFVAGFGSDAPYLADLAEPMLIGPGSLEHAHKKDERVAVKELYEGFLGYRKIVHHARLIS